MQAKRGDSSEHLLRLAVTRCLCSNAPGNHRADLFSPWAGTPPIRPLRWYGRSWYQGTSILGTLKRGWQCASKGHLGSRSSYPVRWSASTRAPAVPLRYMSKPICFTMPKGRYATNPTRLCTPCSIGRYVAWLAYIPLVLRVLGFHTLVGFPG